jgi:uncharacterized protein YkwD
VHNDQRVDTYWCPKTCGKCGGGGGGGGSGSGWQASMLALVNQERAKKGLRAMCINRKLTAAAERHAANMVNLNFYDHTGKDGSSPGARAIAAGYRWTCIAENIAQGQTSVEGVMKSWIESPRHFANILHTKCSSHAGFARAGNIWVQMYGSAGGEGCA